MVDEATKSLAETIQKNVGGTNQNIDQARKMIAILQEVLVQRMKNAAETEAALKVRLDKDLAEVKNNQKMLTSRLETLVSLSDQINKQSAQMEKSIQQSVVSASDQINKQSAQMEKSIQQSLVSSTDQINEKSSQIRESINKAIDMASNSAKSKTDLSNEKLSRLVDILKSFAVEQSKIDKELQVLTASLGNIDQVLQGQKKLDVVLQSQQKVEKAIQGQKLGSIATQETILTTQKKMTEALKDLRRKANVSISRSDDILKKLKKQK